jgi:hypothetical protein
VLEFTGTDSSSVIFHSSTGTLRLDHSSSFTGTISGFGGDGTLAGSDHIDLQDINFNSLQPAQLSASGVLTISDGAHTAHLQFDGSYQLDNFKFADDGGPQHGTIVRSTGRCGTAIAYGIADREHGGAQRRLRHSWE